MDPTRQLLTLKQGSKAVGQTAPRLLRVIHKLKIPVYRFSHIQVFEASYSDQLRRAFRHELIKRGRPAKKKGTPSIKGSPSTSAKPKN